MTNTTYGTWHQAVGGSSLTLHGTVEGALDGYPGIDVDAVAGAYRDAINAALPDWVQLCGDEFYGAADAERPDIKAIIDGIDFWAIVERHDKS